MTTAGLHRGTTIYGSDGNAFVLDRQIGKGGEGVVWSVDGTRPVVAKFYHNGLSADQAQKLEAMCRIKTDQILSVAAWPLATISSSRSGRPDGLLMPRIMGYQEAHLLYSPKSRRTAFPEAQFPFILHAATNIARSFAVVHDAGQVIGDVNHGNVLVSNRATVGLIDCDSFQITERNTTFPCLVGVPTYTPPELQGRNFGSVRRTQAHDAFGLAVLIFHMLFLGRHPFSGIYQHGTADMTIEQAIREFRFAYLSDYGATHMEPPPSAPRLSEFSPPLTALFTRAFTRQGLTSRPSAHEWIAALDSLSKHLKQCAMNRSHQFFDHLASCPWCRVEGMVGIPMFGIVITVAYDDAFNLNAIWAQIEAIQLPMEEQPTPSSKMFYNSCKVNPNIGDRIRQRRSKRLMSIAFIVVAILIVGLTRLEFLPAIIVLSFGLYGMRRVWLLGNLCTQEFSRSYEKGMMEYNEQEKSWVKIKDTPPGFNVIRNKLQEAKTEFVSLPTLRTRKMAELNANRTQKQHQRYLERHRIDDATIPGIGPGRKALLRAYNVEDAYDVVPGKLAQIKGFGPALNSALLAWRYSIEGTFRFDPGQPIDPADLRAVEQELSQMRTNAILALNDGPTQLQRCLFYWRAQQSCALNNLRDAAKHLAQAEIDMRALRTF